MRYVGKGMPGDKAGIQRGDVIVEFDNVRIRDVKHLRETVATTEIGRTVEMKVIRRGEEETLEEKTLRVQPIKRTDQVVQAFMRGSSRDVLGGEDGEAFAGLNVSELTDQLAATYRHEGEKGVIVVHVERGSPAAKAGIRRGDLIQEINRKTVTTIADYRQQIKDVADKPKFVLYVRHRNGVPRYVVLKNSESQR